MGIDVERPVGSPVRQGDVVLVVHHRGGRGLDEAIPLLTSAVRIDDVPPVVPPVVVEEVA